jgi:hypothetical protein
MPSSTAPRRPALQGQRLSRRRPLAGTRIDGPSCRLLSATGPEAGAAAPGGNFSAGPSGGGRCLNI